MVAPPHCYVRGSHDLPPASHTPWCRPKGRAGIEHGSALPILLDRGPTTNLRSLAPRAPRGLRGMYRWSPKTGTITFRHEHAARRHPQRGTDLALQNASMRKEKVTGTCAF